MAIGIRWDALLGEAAGLVDRFLDKTVQETIQVSFYCRYLHESRSLSESLKGRPLIGVLVCEEALQDGFLHSAHARSLESGDSETCLVGYEREWAPVSRCSLVARICTLVHLIGLDHCFQAAEYDSC